MKLYVRRSSIILQDLFYTTSNRAGIYFLAFYVGARYIDLLPNPLILSIGLQIQLWEKGPKNNLPKDKTVRVPLSRPSQTVKNAE